tara:strand:+ start:5949 stop:6170 length:222 start_codon:yes stop_codon:yes gene_type:complete
MYSGSVKNNEKKIENLEEQLSIYHGRYKAYQAELWSTSDQSRKRFIKSEMDWLDREMQDIQKRISKLRASSGY